MRKGPWTLEQIEDFLGEALIPVRLACNGSTGFPLLASLWFVPIEGHLWCATQASARIVGVLERDPRVGFEVSVEAPPYRGIRGRGRVRLEPGRGEETLRKLLDRYLGGEHSSLARSLLARSDTEVALAIEPETLISWDYRARMSDAA